MTGIFSITTSKGKKSFTSGGKNSFLVMEKIPSLVIEKIVPDFHQRKHDMGEFLFHCQRVRIFGGDR